MKPLNTMFHLSLNGHNGCRISKGGIGETDGRCPLHRIDNHLLNFRLMIDGEHLMARTEVENLSFSAMPAATAAEHFSAFEPNKNGIQQIAINIA